MPPKALKKRKAATEHAKVGMGRQKIRKGPAGKKLVEETVRNNSLLFLERLKDEEAKNTAGTSFQAKLAAAAAGAMDPVVGPEAVIDLSTYSFEDLTIFGNKEAGQLMAGLLSLIDDGGNSRFDEMKQEMQKGLDEKDKQLEKEKEHKEKVENSLAYLQALIPISQSGQRGLATRLEALDSDKDAGWLYGILWNSCLQWMDTRLRQMRAYGDHLKIKPMEPLSLSERSQMLNIRVHGGDLRVDAIISQISFGDIRHLDGNYDFFFHESFKRMYNLSIDDGLWLAKHGYAVTQGVDWPRLIGFIDKFVAILDRVVSWGKQTPANLQDVYENRWKPFCAHVASLIKKAKADEKWTADVADTNTTIKLRNELTTDCLTWKIKATDDDQITKMSMAKYTWPPADYLKGQPTAQSRSAGQGGAEMKLRPQVRIKYTA